MVVVNYKGEEKHFAVEEISFMILTEMREIAEACLDTATVVAISLGSTIYFCLLSHSVLYLQFRILGLSIEYSGGCPHLVGVSTNSGFPCGVRLPWPGSLCGCFCMDVVSLGCPKDGCGVKDDGFDSDAHKVLIWEEDSLPVLHVG
ncbi:hypothetical protein NL676_014339 [Syzygium grande]|nr:hypothetical protein NL676_014339 [Syzygium grande]